MSWTYGSPNWNSSVNNTWIYGFPTWNDSINQSNPDITPSNNRILSFSEATVGTLFSDRRTSGYPLQIIQKVTTGPNQAQKIVAVDQVTGQLYHIPKNDFWGYIV